METVNSSILQYKTQNNAGTMTEYTELKIEYRHNSWIAIKTFDGELIERFPIPRQIVRRILKHTHYIRVGNTFIIIN